MKFKDLTKEEQKHFLEVVKYCKENGLEDQLEEAVYIDHDCSEYMLVNKNKETYMGKHRGAKWFDAYLGKLYQKPEDYLTLLTGTNQMTTKESKVTVQELKEETFKPLKITLEIFKEEDLLALIAALMPTDDNIEGCIKYESLLEEDTKGKFIKSLHSSTILDELSEALETYNK